MGPGSLIARRALLRSIAFCLVAVCSTDVLSRESLAANPAFQPTASVAILTVTRAGSGRGRIVSYPRGIVCGSDCSEAFPTGTVLTLRARPFEGSTFTGWSGPCWGMEPCTVEMRFHRSVTATFAGTF